MEEPSVLDYLKDLFSPWKKDKIRIPDEAFPVQKSITGEDHLSGAFEQLEQLSIEPETIEPSAVAEPKVMPLPQPEQSGAASPFLFPWLLILALFFAIAAQLFMEPPEPQPRFALVGYSLALISFLGYILRRPIQILRIEPMPFKLIKVRSTSLFISFFMAFVAFITFSSHQFEFINTTCWLLAIGFGLHAFWQKVPSQSDRSIELSGWIRKGRLGFRINPWIILVIVSALVVAFFRFYQLEDVPGEMFSDHAEKLLDVSDVLNGNHWIYFQRNTGREFFQMYLTAAVSRIFNTGISFMSLKIGTALAGFFALPFIYLLGKEIKNRWTGLLAFLFAGFAYWPNVISRIGLRFPLYPLFVAPVLFFLIRGLRRLSWNDFLLSGLFLGLGLHGYSPMRFVPFVVASAVILYLLHPQSRGHRRFVIYAFIVIAFIAFLVFIPLLRYWFDDPTMFVYRSLSRMGTIEREYPLQVSVIFFNNLWKAMIMFFKDNGNIWVHSLPNRPALSVIPAGLFFIGLVYLVLRYIRRPNWLDSFLLISIPMLMMPSILSLAFPEENPSLNRTGGAIVPVFIMIALVVELLLSRLADWKKNSGTIMAAGLVIVMLIATASQDYDLVFRQFKEQFMAGAWNTSELGRVIHGFADSSLGNSDTAYVVPFPHWVDTRLVGINAGYPDKDFALWPDQFFTTVGQPGAKLFLIKPEDQQSILDLQELYPLGSYWLHSSEYPGKEFWVFFVPFEPGITDMEP